MKNLLSRLYDEVAVLNRFSEIFYHVTVIFTSKASYDNIRCYCIFQRQTQNISIPFKIDSTVSSVRY